MIRRAIVLVNGLLLATSCLWAQGAPLPYTKIQFFGNSGQPLSLGQVCTYSSGTTTPLATYTDYTLTVQNQQCVPLDPAGRASIWLAPVLYRVVVKDSASVTLFTQDGVSAVAASGGGGSGTLWTANGNTIYNSQASSRVCITSNLSCSALSLLNINGAGSSTQPLVRIDDANGSPGIAFFGSGNATGYVSGDSGGLRLRSADGTAQLTVTQGSVLVQNGLTSGATQFTVQAGTGQSANNLLQVRNVAGTNLAWIDALGRFVSPLYNSTGTGAAITFQNSNSFFSVNGFGDASVNGQLNVVGTNDTVNGGGDAAIKVGGTAIVDNARNATFTTLTCTSTPCGSGGGGGGLPVPDSTVIVYNSGDPTKKIKFSAGSIATATTRTYTFPDADVDVMGRQNTETVTGTKVFTQLVTGNAGFTGINYNATNTGSSITFQNANSNFLVNGNGDVTAVGNGVVGGYWSAVGAVSSNTFLGTKCTASAPGATPNATYSGIAYKGGSTNCTTGGSGLHFWVYDQVHSAWSDIDLGSVAGGITSINGQTGAAQTIAGTVNQISVVTTSNTQTLHTAQDIGTTSIPTFGGVVTGAGGAFNSGATTSAISFQNTNNFFSVNGYGDVSLNGQINVVGTNDAVNGGGNSAIKINGTTAIDNARNGNFNNITISGTCTGPGCGGGGGGGVTTVAGCCGVGALFQQIAVNGDFSGAAYSGAVSLSLPQNIGTTAAVTFGSVVSKVFNSTANAAILSPPTPAQIAFQVQNITGTPIQIDGSGNISAAGDLNLTGLGSQYSIGGNAVINHFRQFVGSGIDVGSGGISAGGYNVNGGFIGQSYTVTIPGMSISGTGCTGGLIFRSGVLVSCF